MKENGFDVIMISAPGIEIEDLTNQEQCPHISVPFKRNIHLIKDIICLFQLIKVIHRLKPDIVHTHTPKAGLLGMIAAFACGVPIRLHTIAGLPWINYKGIARYFMKLLERITALLSTAIYPNSHNLKRFLSSENIGKRKLKVLGLGTSNGIDTDYFKPGIDHVENKATYLRNLRNLKRDSLVWLYVGRIVKEKGIGELIESFIRLKTIFPDDELWLVGEEETERDPLTPEHLNVIRKSKSIVKWGFQADVRPFMAASRVLVFPSYREGFPNVPLQAACMQCAMILSDINGCNEIVENYNNGVLVPSKNANMLYNAMYTLRVDTDLRRRISSQAREIVVKRYSTEIIWKALLKEYIHWLNLKKIEHSVIIF
jgi:glycosyltransferase involved in cell wall biosynthesis